MTETLHRVVTVRDRPLQQCCRFLAWFAECGVKDFDIHVKRIKTGEMPQNQNQGKWITVHNGLTLDEVHRQWNWWRRENANGAEIYIRPHGEGVHPVIFLDDIALGYAHKIARKYSCAVVETSKNNTHVWLKTAKALNKLERKAIQNHLSNECHSDAASISGDHLGRMCGMFSQKRQCWVNAKLFSTPREYNPPDITQLHPLGGGGARVSSSQGRDSPSEREFGWVIGMLKAGIATTIVFDKVKTAAEQRGKKSAPQYASLTVKKAEAALKA